MPSKITSPANARIKDLVRLRESAERRKTGLILVDGIREIARAQAAGFTCRELYCLAESLKTGHPECAGVLKKCPPPIELSEPVFEKISYGGRDDGWVAVFQAPASPETLPIVKNPLYLVLDHLEKPGNIGAILRTADAAGVAGVLICDSPTDLYNPNIIRASTGTVFSLPIVCWTKEKTFDFLKSRKIRICAADPDSSKVYTQMDLSSDIAVVLGREDKGVSGFWMDAADAKVKIPMNGQADSLNVSISAAVILYEAVRQRTKT